MAAELHNTSGYFRVWAMTPPYKDGYVIIEPITRGAVTMDKEDLQHFVHDITAAVRKVEDYNGGKTAA